MLLFENSIIDFLMIVFILVSGKLVLVKVVFVDDCFLVVIEIEILLCLDVRLLME